MAVAESTLRSEGPREVLNWGSKLVAACNASVLLAYKVAMSADAHMTRCPTAISSTFLKRASQFPGAGQITEFCRIKVFYRTDCRLEGRTRKCCQNNLLITNTSHDLPHNYWPLKFRRPVEPTFDMPVPGILLDKDEQDKSSLKDALSPLQLAPWQDDLSTVTILLKQGANPNEEPRGWYGKTALQAAALQGHVKIAKLLLEAGAIVDAPGGNNGGCAALALAAGAGHDAAVESLLNAGADVNLPPHRYMGCTPLQAAAEFGKLSIVKTLVAAGAELDGPVAQHFGRTPLQAAAENGHGNLVDFLLESGASANFPPSRNRGITALQGAAVCGSVEIVRRLLKAGADVNAEGSRYMGGAALWLAAGAGHVEVMEMLLDARADVKALSRNQGKLCTALQRANWNGRSEAVDLLTDRQT
ncbi:ankyrin [Ophiobolus disseminans]|uniref:Ankyrin n=1 Tax=Ophiobolus disseminans TaxID=1469910 RepID=A0A6A7A8I4_9PLEO|nr:ankyrin [Ophiobolus disseminans]